MRFRNSLISDYLILLVAILIGMFPMISGIATMKWDAMDIYLPWKFFVGESVRNQILPLWNPFMNSGFPQMGDVNTWYPVSWIIMLFKRYDVVALHLEYLLHLYLAGIGMYKVAQQSSFSRKTRLLLAISYMLCGFFISNAQHVGWIISATWLPFIYYYFVTLHTRPNLLNAIKLAMCFFLMLSGGYPGIFISTFYLFLNFAVYRLIKYLINKKFQAIKKWLLYLFLSAIIFGLLSSVVLVSSLDLSKHITRGGGLPFDNSHWGILSGSLPLKALFTFIFPYAASINDASFWGTDFSIVNCYMGIVPLLLCLFVLFQKNVAFKARAFIIIGVLFLLIAFAEVTPFRKWLYLCLPMMDLFRFSALFRIFAIFFLLLAAGFGMEHLLKTKDKLRSFFVFLIIALAIIGVAEGYLFFHIEKWQFKQLLVQGLTGFDKLFGIKEKMFFQGAFQIGILLILLLIYKFKPKFLLISIVIVGFTDIVAASRLNLYATVVSDYPTKKVNEAISKLPTGYPLPSLQLPMIKTTDTALMSRIPYVWRNLAIYQKMPSCDGNSPYGLYTMNKALDNKNYQVTLQLPLLFLTSLKNNAPLIDTSSIDRTSHTKITITAFTTNLITVKINTGTALHLVFQQNTYPGWQATVNNHQQSIKTVNDTYMAVSLNPGQNVATFEFKPTKVILAFYLSLGCFVILLVILIIHWMQRLLGK